jgi:hypothetical protein
VAPAAAASAVGVVGAAAGRGAAGVRFVELLIVMGAFPLEFLAYKRASS